MENERKTILRVHRRSEPFVQVDTEVIRNPKLSLKSKGLLTLMLSYDDGWTFNLKHLKKQSTDKITSLTSGMKELEKARHVWREYPRHNGKFRNSIIHVYEIPYKSTADRKPVHGFLVHEKPDTKNINYKNINRIYGERRSVPHAGDENPLIGKDNSFITRYAQKLHTILKIHSNGGHPAKVETYAKYIRQLLHTEDMEQERFRKVFKFYIETGRHKQYCARIYRVSDIVDNFLRIEDAMNIHNNPPKKQTGDPEQDELNEYEDAMSKVKTRILPDGTEEDFLPGEE